MDNEKTGFEKSKEAVLKSWDWVWNSDSLLSWIVALILIFILVKFVFFPVLSLIMGTILPLAGVESSSMDHGIVKDDFGRLGLCGNIYTPEEDEHVNFNEYWQECGGWYEENGISKEEFSEFSLRNGFSKGDILVVWGRFTPKVGDVIIFKPNSGSSAPRPIVHRLVSIEKQGGELVMGTKGDHNEKQLTGSNNLYKTDETNIRDNQVIGKVLFKIPYLGWLKIWFTEFFNKLV
jgi:signal peptidase I